MTWILLLGLAGDEITVEKLLDEMADLARLTKPADYVTRQFSSYDRKSDKGDVFANDDAGNYLRVENGWHVMAEADGPGAIVRIWSANPEGTVRIWLDGEVVIEEDFGKLLRGRVKPFVEPFAGERGRGCNLYFPLPYAKSMKVATSKGGQYYHVNYRTYAKQTGVRTLTLAKLHEVDVEQARRAISLDVREYRGASLRNETLKVSPGRTVALKELEGPARIVLFSVTPRFRDLRSVVVRMRFDGELAVSCPVGDFFGTSPGAAVYDTLAIHVTESGTGYCSFPMPFAKSAVIEFLNEGLEDADLTVGVLTEDCKDADKRLRFHAWWNGNKNLKTRPMSEWSVLKGDGRGRYVGTALYVRNPVKHWWGEGDEKIYLDGEKFPSTFGTGTEDYFGYAWGDTSKFNHAYHSQSRCDGPVSRGFTALNRFHILDDIPFQKSIRFDLEVWSWADCEMGFATVAYWYAEPGFRHEMKEIPLEERAIVPLPEVKPVPGAQEGEKLKVLEKTGKVEPQDLSPFWDTWSGDTHLWWHDAKLGDVLRLEFTSEKDGKQTLLLAMTKACDYAIVKISVNGAVIDEKRDLYDPHVVPTGEIEYSVELKKGVNELRVEIAGTNEKANPKNHRFGLDYLRIK